ncbi:OmpA family protein [Vibrio alfacsensis]|uniref:OmpA family protein n=1 Tax=Vibrio alfacsensis TaxID=1074311 RepID=UPI001BEE984E|nr:OmpA family protein [Vibrio alfacsensis]BBM65380.1 membrane protein [Vibrio alfacsensis]BCN23494.1 membrane protein [Vibrio alfacsensis]
MKKLAAVISATLLMASAAHAEVYVGGKMGKSWMDDACVAGHACDKDGSTLGAFVGYEMNDYLSVETGFENLGDFDQTGFGGHVEAITLAPKFSLPITEDIALYGKVGGAYLMTEGKNDYSYLGAAGVEFNVSHNVTARAEYQTITDINNDVVKAAGNTATLGVSFKFGGNDEVVVEEEPVVAEVVEEVVVAPVVVTKTFETQTVGTDSFALNSTELSANSADKLNDLVAFLNEYPQANVDVIGYTDTSGSAAYNQKVSEKRAESVAHALVAKGIDASRIHARGEGENNPIASNDTREGREQNRRVEIVVPEFDYQVQQ